MAVQPAGDVVGDNSAYLLRLADFGKLGESAKAARFVAARCEPIALYTGEISAEAGDAVGSEYFPRVPAAGGGKKDERMRPGVNAQMSELEMQYVL